MSDPELAAAEGGFDRLRLHLIVEHGAHAERDYMAWEDGAWTIALYGVDPDNPLSLPRLNLSDLPDEEEQGSAS